MAAVPGILLDHVYKHRAQRDRRAVTLAPDGAEIVHAADKPLRESDLVALCVPRLGDDARVVDRTIPVIVAIVLAAKAWWCMLAGHHSAKPVPLHLGTMSR